jgi:hypothetical protein
MATVSYIPTAKLIALLSKADPQRKLNVRVLNTTRLSLDNESFQPISIIDLASEDVLGPDETPVAFDVSAPKASRKSGEYEVTVYGKTVTGYSLKIVLGEALRVLEQKKPGTLEKLSKIRPGTKRIVARDPADLFVSADLAKKFGEKLMTDWYYGTNNSAQEVNAWLSRAADCAGADFGKDIKTSF